MTIGSFLSLESSLSAHIFCTMPGRSVLVPFDVEEAAERLAAIRGLARCLDTALKPLWTAGLAKERYVLSGLRQLINKHCVRRACIACTIDETSPP